MWATEDAGASEVRTSRDHSYSTVTPAASSVYDSLYWHFATLTGLAAGTAYRYRTYTGGSDVTPWPEITFTTAPAITETAFTFVAFGDSRPASASALPSQGALDVAAELARQSFDLAIHVADIVNSGGICSGADSAWKQYIRAYYDVYVGSTGHTPFYLSVGNHELSGGTCGYQAYTEVYALPANAPAGQEERYYSFDWGNAHLIALDTTQSYVAGSVQHNWLLDDLEASHSPWTFVYFHHPAYSSGAHGSTALVQQHLVPVFEAYGVDVVLNGHDHHYERTCPILDGACTTTEAGGVIYYVAGGGGAPLRSASGDWFTAYSDSLYHFVKVEVSDCQVSLQSIDTEGTVFDSAAIGNCPTAVRLASLSAAVQGDAVRVEWKSAIEVDLLGYHLYRGESLNGEYVRLNTSLIPGQGVGSLFGARYDWVDRDIRPETSYTYRLESVSVLGTRTSHGPVRVSVGELVPYTVYLPVVSAEP
ncbi:MAG: metallophosphoesterase family protein [Anaerolineae bacterium]|nr:metallophosphoesterase family protein [Anaerolineae bacterium]